jgi:hypothetical protein
MQSMHIHVLGPGGSRRAALERAVAGLGCTVSAAEPAAGSAAPGADALMVDVRGDQAEMAGLAAGLVADARPALVVSEGASPLVAELARRPAGANLVRGEESEAGYRVALSLLAGLRASSLWRAAANGSLTGTAAL